MEFRLLGAPDFRPAPRAAVTGRRLALLVALLVRRGAFVLRDDLVEDLWGLAPPPTAVNALQVHVSRLRRLLNRAPTRARVVTLPDGYALQLGERDWLDVEAFERLAATATAVARERDHAPAAATARRALALWRGSAAAAGVSLEGPARQELLRLEALRIDVLALRIDAELATGRHGPLLAELRKIVTEHPYDERFARQLMLALYRSGRQAEALAVYHDARRLLSTGLGIEPSPELRRVEQAILRHDDSLELQPSTAVPDPERRTVSVVFVNADFEGQPLVDPERETALHRRWLKIARQPFEQAGVTLTALPTGDAYAVFGVASAREDEARIAAATALSVNGRLTAYAERLARRDRIALRFAIGVATGRAVVGPDAPHPTRIARTAAAIARLGEPQTVLVTRSTAALLGEAASMREVAAWNREPVLHLLELESGASCKRGVFVGREREMDELAQAIAAGLAEPRAAIALLGPAGIGKSRLVDACLAQLEDARVLKLRCGHTLQAPALQPLHDAIERLAGLPTLRDALEALLGDGRDAAPTAAVLLSAFGPTRVAPSPADLVWAVTRLLHRLAAGSLVLVLEDLQSAQAQLLELVGTALHRLHDARIAVVCVIRTSDTDAGVAHEFARVLQARELELGPLSPDAAAAMLAELEKGVLSPAACQWVLEAADGNPLFIEQLVAHLAGGASAQATLPPTLHALLSARLGGLGSDERAFLSRAAVVPGGFGLDLVATLARSSEDELAPIADEFVRRRLLERNGDTYRFRHALVREVAYDAMPKWTRAELHVEAANWFEEHDSPAAVVGLHLAEAVALWREIGRFERRSRGLAARAADLLAAGGREANGHGRVEESVGLLRRAAELIDEKTPSAPRILCDYAEALREQGDACAAQEMLGRAVASATVHADEGRLRIAFHGSRRTRRDPVRPTAL